MKISVVIPLYNKAAHIKRAVDSVLSQTEQDFEIIIIDDGSTDGGGDIVKSYSDSRIKYAWQQNAGVSVARNNGIKQAQADFVGFLDADDEYAPKFIETVLALRQKYPQAGIYSTAYSLVEADGRKAQPKYLGMPNFPWEGLLLNYFESALGAPPVSTITVGIPKAIFNIVGYFPAGEGLGEDLDMWFRIVLKYPVAFSSYEGAIYYRNAGNRCCNAYKTADVYIKTIQTAIANGGVTKEYIPNVTGMLDKQLVLTASHCIVAGDKIIARQYLSKAQSNIFKREKNYWLFWSYIPHPVFKVILWFKLNILNRLVYIFNLKQRI